MFDQLTSILQAYTRPFVSQGVGIIGLVWCLAAGQTTIAVVLTGLVLIDQAIFLRASATRFDVPYRRVLDGCCLTLSGVDILIGLAAAVRSGGLRDGVNGAAANTPADCLAYVLFMFTHGSTTLAPATPGGRLLGAVIAALGILAMLAGLAVALRRPNSSAQTTARNRG